MTSFLLQTKSPLTILFLVLIALRISAVSSGLPIICRQLSSLSQHAEDMFRELSAEAGALYDRTCQLQNKVENLKDSVRQFDPNQVVSK